MGQLRNVLLQLPLKRLDLTQHLVKHFTHPRPFGHIFLRPKPTVGHAHTCQKWMRANFRTQKLGLEGFRHILPFSPSFPCVHINLKLGVLRGARVGLQSIKRFECKCPRCFGFADASCGCLIAFGGEWISQFVQSRIAVEWLCELGEFHALRLLVEFFGVLSHPFAPMVLQFEVPRTFRAHHQMSSNTFCLMFVSCCGYSTHWTHPCTLLCFCWLVPTRHTAWSKMRHPLFLVCSQYRFHGQFSTKPCNYYSKNVFIHFDRFWPSLPNTCETTADGSENCICQGLEPSSFLPVVNMSCFLLGNHSKGTVLATGGGRNFWGLRSAA